MMDTSQFTIQIEGPGLTMKREVEEPLVLKVLGILLGPKTPTFGSGTAPAMHTPTSAPPLGANLGESPREYLDRSGAKTNAEKITALGLYLRAQGAESFTARDLRQVFVSAGEPTPKNLARDIKDSVRTGWLALRPDQPDRLYITNRGETAAAGGFTDRSPVPRRPKRAKGTNGSNAEGGSSDQHSVRNGGSARSVLEELLAEGYFGEPRTYHDIMQTALEKGHRLRRTDLTQPLLDLVQERPPRLRRQKVTASRTGRAVWAYSIAQNANAA
jgi:hypothetical protein